VTTFGSPWRTRVGHDGDTQEFPRLRLRRWHVITTRVYAFHLLIGSQPRMTSHLQRLYKIISINNQDGLVCIYVHTYISLLLQPCTYGIFFQLLICSFRELPLTWSAREFSSTTYNLGHLHTPMRRVMCSCRTPPSSITPEPTPSFSRQVRVWWMLYILTYTDESTSAWIPM
jgi:hypothetical protein